MSNCLYFHQNSCRWIVKNGMVTTSCGGYFAMSNRIKVHLISEVVDMEIDMIAVKDVSKVDIPISKELFTGGRRSSDCSTTATIMSNVSPASTPAPQKRSNASIVLPSSDVKSKNYDDIPPGFSAALARCKSAASRGIRLSLPEKTKEELQ